MIQQHRGNVILIVVVLVALIVGGWQIGEYRSRQKQQRETAALAERQRIEDEKRRMEEDRRQAELKAVEQREAEAKSEKDALRESLKKVDEFVVRWEDASRVAGVTSRIALTGPVSAMQNLKREVETLTVPPCLDAGKAALTKSIGVTVEAYMIFMVEKGDMGKTLTSGLLNIAEEDLGRYKSIRASCPT